MPDNLYRIDGQEYPADDIAGATPPARAIEAHRKRIEPWLASIFQSEHLNLLVGSGYSTALARAAGANPVTMDVGVSAGVFAEQIRHAADVSARGMGRGSRNIEDEFRAALALLEGLEILEDGRAATLRAEINSTMGTFADSIAEMEAGILRAIAEDRAKAATFERLLVEFLLSFASRTATRDRLHVFTTNYDRLIEHGFDRIGARPIDRFVGGLSPRFRASRFEVDIHYTPPGGRSDARPLEGVVRYTKLHGSIDWWAEGGEIVRKASSLGERFRGREPERLMIFPNAAKDIETAFYPYAELFRDFAAAVCRPNAALVTYGYGYGDSHVNRIIRDMLTLPSTHLVVIAYGDSDGRVQSFIDSCGRSAQISKIVGPAIADIGRLVDHFLPKPAIDLITERQTKLLEARLRPDERSRGENPGPEDLLS